MQHHLELITVLYHLLSDIFSNEIGRILRTSHAGYKLKHPCGNIHVVILALCKAAAAVALRGEVVQRSFPLTGSKIIFIV